MPGKIIKVLSNKITPDIWKNVRIGVTENGKVNLSEKYFTSLLHDLISDKAQCFLFYKEGSDTDVQAVAVTRLRHDPMSDQKYLRIEAFYTADKNIDFEKGLEFTANFARSEQCSFIVLETLNREAMEMATKLGFQETKRRYEHRI